MPMLTFYHFDCPNGHLLLIEKDQRTGDRKIRCDVDGCDFNGYVESGLLKEEITVPEWTYY